MYSVYRTKCHLFTLACDMTRSGPQKCSLPLGLVGLMPIGKQIYVAGMLQILSLIPSFSTLHIKLGRGPFRIVILSLFF